MANNPPGAGNRNQGWLYSLFVAAMILIGLAVAVLILWRVPPIWRWAWMAFLMVAVLMWAGYRGTTWGALGALVDPQRGKYSLGQLQLVMWTLLVISAWVAIVVTRIALQVPDGSEVTQLVTELAESYQQVKNAPTTAETREKLQRLVDLKRGLPEAEEADAAQTATETPEVESDVPKTEIETLEEDLSSLLVGEYAGLPDRIVDREQQLRTILEADVTFADALNVEIPTEVLLLLGISAASLIGGTVIKNDKGPGGSKPPEAQTLDYSNAQRHSTMLAADPSGAATPERLSWLDIFKGDQVGDKTYIDIGKFQMFWFTAAALVAYGMQIASLIDMASSNEVLQAAGLTGTQVSRLGFALVTSLPAVSTSLAGVLAISHGAYLANKVPNRPGVGGADGEPEGEAQEKIKIVSLQVGTVDAAGAFQAASDGVPAGLVAVQVQPQSSVSSAAVTGATIQVELRPTTGEAVPVTIDMAGETTKHNVSPEPLAAGEWQAVVTEAKADDYDGLDPASENRTKGFQVV